MITISGSAGRSVAGFAWPDNTERLLDGAVWAATERQGRGNVSMFADDILFRGSWRGLRDCLRTRFCLGQEGEERR